MKVQARCYNQPAGRSVDAGPGVGAGAGAGAGLAPVRFCSALVATVAATVRESVW